MSNNSRVTRSRTNRSPKSPSQVDEVPEVAVVDRSVSLLASRWNTGIVFATVILLCFVTVRFTMSRELNQLDNVLNMDRAYFHNVTTHLSQMYSQLRNGMPNQQTVPNTQRGPRTDHAQFHQGAKIVRFSGEEVSTPSSFGDWMKQSIGFNVPKGACRILSKRLNKNKFLTFKGDRAKLLIELNQAVFLDTFKIEHFIANLNDTNAIGMMPKTIILSGIRKSSNNAIILGQLRVPLSIDSNLQSAVLQINEPRESFEWFQMEVLNNHGRKELTRVYKIRMYGEIDESK